MMTTRANPTSEPKEGGHGTSAFAGRTFGRPPELLAPAGDWECAKAAIENGADAIYFGLEKFNARMRARNFTEADLPQLIEFLHRRGVKGYITFNILIFENELAEAERFLRKVIAAGVDAAVVQDVGICRLIRRLSPDFPIHASTQMTITSTGGIEFARDLGCNLVVLARECSVKEIETMTAGSPSPAGDPGGPRVTTLPLEVFVHGALCVAYSGQCLTSEALGGRSANRGECAQACRMPYDLVADGKPVALGDRKYLLSPQDLAGLSVLPELVRAGVASLKIEGRLKSPEYVASITRIYRAALDAAIGRPEALGVVSRTSTSARPGSQPGTSPGAEWRSPQYKMEMAFSRGLYTGWFHGVNNQELVHGRFGKKRGVYLGQVLAVRGDSVLVGLAGQLQPGDGIVFDAGRPGEPEQGGRVYQVETGSEARRALARETTAPHANSAPVPGHTHESVGREAKSTPPDLPPALLFFGTGDLDLRRVHPGDRLWKTSDPGLERSLRQSFEGEVPRFQRPVQIELHGRAGLPLSLIARDEDGIEVRMESAMPLAVAGKQPLSMGRLREQLGRLGGTPFKLGELNNYLEGDVLLPISELNRLRRDFVSRLLSLRAEPRGWRLVAGPLGVWECDGKSKSEPPVVSSAGASVPQLLVLVRDLAQLDAALAAGVEIVYCDFEDPKKYREAVKRFRRETHRPTSSAIFVAPPRVSKPGEDWILNQVRSCEPDGYLVRNFDHLKFFQTGRRVGDYSLNVANRIAAGYFKTRFDLERITPSYDLNFAQLEALLRAAPPHWFEVTLHQHIPMFHMEHCVFCAFLSTGTNYTNCGRPCDTRELKLRDRVGAEHPVKADAGCRNTVFNALAQTGADYASRMIALGVRHFRLEFLNENPSVVAQTLDRYGQLLRGQISGPDLWRDLKLLNQLGVTRGQMGGAAAG